VMASCGRPAKAFALQGAAEYGDVRRAKAVAEPN
jgi:hypothetical protein